MKIKKGDKIIVEAGKDKGKTGVVTKLVKDSDKVVVEKINIVKKHVKPQGKGSERIGGGIISMEAPISASNVMIVCPSCNKATRVLIRKEKGAKTRVCKKCQKTIEFKDEAKK